MRTNLEQLLEMQSLQFGPLAKPAEVPARLAALKESVPAALFAHYERMTSRGRKCVAIARGGVCSECHLLIATGTLANLGKDGLLHTCDNCGRYLYLPKETAAVAAPAPAPIAAPRPASGKKPKGRPRRIPPVAE
jgi:hypothetical protein